MFQNGIKITSSQLIWKKHGLRDASRLYSSVCLHCKGNGAPAKSSRLLLPRKNYSSGVEQPRRGHPIRNTLVLLGLTTGAVVGYAKYDPEFRKILEDISPGFNDFIKVVTFEGNSFDKTVDSITGAFSGLLGDSASDKKPSNLPPSLPKPIISKSEAKRPESRIQSSEAPALPPPPPLERPSASEKKSVQSSPSVNPKTRALGNLDDEIRIAATSAISALSDANRAVQGFAEEVGKVLDSGADIRETSIWNNIKSKTANREKLLSAAERAVSDASAKLNNVKSAIDTASVPQLEKERLRRLVTAASGQIESSRRELDAQKQRGSLPDRYWSQVEEARRHFQEEIEALFPNASITDKKLNLGSEDLDLFLVHVFSHVLHYQREIARLESIGDQQIRQALAKSGEPVNDQLIDLRVRQAVEKERRRLEEDLQKKLVIAQGEQERLLRTLLKRQLEAADDHLKDVLTAKEGDLERRVTRRLDEQASSERADYDTKLTAMLGKLKGLEQVLDERIQADRNAHQAHVLFSACQQLFRALRSGVPGAHWSDQLRPLDAEISAVSNAVGGQDSLVSTVLDSVPPEARKRGVYPETALRERFLRVEQVARRVALVPAEGGSLLRYLLSYVQSTLLFTGASPISSKELKDEPFDVATLNTYDLLQRARYWVDRGDLQMCLRYMHLLNGAPRAVASQWMDEVRIYLETQQVVNTLMAHAAATGMLYL